MEIVEILSDLKIACPFLNHKKEIYQFAGKKNLPESDEGVWKTSPHPYSVA